MDLKELKEKLESVSTELKSKVPTEARVLVESQNIMIGMILEMNTSMSNQLETMQKQNEKLSDTLKDLQETIKELRRQLGQNSKNSSKPPSTDGFKRNRSLRKKSGLKAGGQKGHSGAHMELPHEPDETRQHLPSKCKTCPHLAECLASNKVFTCGESRFVVEPVITTKVIEHQIIKVTCCPCGEKSELKGEFPSEIKARIQYGKGMTVLAGILSTFGAVSIERIRMLINLNSSSSVRR